MHRSATGCPRRICSLMTNGRAPSVSARRRAAARAAEPRRGDHRRDRPRGARSTPSAGGPVRARPALRRRAGARPLRRRRSSTRAPSTTPTAARSTSSWAAARCAPAARSTRCCPPTASARASRGSGASPRARRAGFDARDALPPRLGDLRLHRPDLRRVGRGLRGRAVGHAGRAPAPPPRARPPAGPRRRRRRGGPRPRPARASGRARDRRRRSSSARRDADRFASRLGGEAIAAADAGARARFVPDPTRPAATPSSPPRWAARPRRSARPSPLERAAGSLHRAQAAFGLQERGLLPPPSPLRSDEHLPDLLLHGDGALAADLAARALAPLDDLRAGAARALSRRCARGSTSPGQVSRVAERLHVHPQTVRYRMAQLRELFGDAPRRSRRALRAGAGAARYARRRQRRLSGARARHLDDERRRVAARHDADPDVAVARAGQQPPRRSGWPARS